MTRGPADPHSPPPLAAAASSHAPSLEPVDVEGFAEAPLVALVRGELTEADGVPVVVLQVACLRSGGKAFSSKFFQSL